MNYLTGVIGKGLMSSVTSADHPELTLSLQLLGGDSTFNRPEQHWQFQSNFAVRIYLPLYRGHLS